MPPRRHARLDIRTNTSLAAKPTLPTGKMAKSLRAKNDLRKEFILVENTGGDSLSAVLVILQVCLIEEGASCGVGDIVPNRKCGWNQVFFSLR